MTVKECYEKIGGNFDEAMERFMMEELADRFLIKFLEDKSMQMLKVSVDDGNIEEAFRAAHTLKGVCANMAFTTLCNYSSELTEQLRSLTSPIDMKLYERVDADYNRIIAIIKQYEAEKNRYFY